MWVSQWSQPGSNRRPPACKDDDHRTRTDRAREQRIRCGQGMVGSAWQKLADGLLLELQTKDPEARVNVSIDMYGLLRLKPLVNPKNRAWAQATSRRFVARAVSECESCGSSIGHVSAGSVLVFLCTECRAD